MRKYFLLSGLIILLAGTIGCGIFVRHQTAVTPPRGFLLETYKAPLMTDFRNKTNVSKSSIKVSSSKTLYFHDMLLTGMNFAWEEASVPEIARSGGIQNVTYADYEMLNILGVYAEFRINVYGY